MTAKDKSQQSVALGIMLAYNNYQKKQRAQKSLLPVNTAPPGLLESTNLDYSSGPSAFPFNVSFRSDLFMVFTTNVLAILSSVVTRRRQNQQCELGIAEVGSIDAIQAQSGLPWKTRPDLQVRRVSGRQQPQRIIL